MPSRLSADFEITRGSFRLRVRLDAGSEILVLFGPSGSGKTTTLDAIAGLAVPAAGEITLDGRILFRKDRDGAWPGPAANVPARLRGVGYVFQHYALFPHLNALENVAYPFGRARDRNARALAWLERVGLAHLAAHYPGQLSGGQQQRVALARALAAEPAALLLDEPFSALDIAVRQRLQSDLTALQREMGLVVIYVTHRLEDALAVGHRLAVLQDGRLEQIGPIEEVFHYPANRQVAEIMGLRNLFRARVAEAGLERLVLDWDGLLLDASPQPAEPGALITAYIRPEDVKILYPDRPLMPAVRTNRVRGRVQAISLSPGARVLTVLLSNGHEIEVRHPPAAYIQMQLEPGKEVQLSLRREALVLL